MDWFRHYHGLVTDPKLHKVSRKAKVRRSVVIAAWCAILETASQSAVRGCAEDIDADTLAYLIDETPAVAGRVLEALQALDLLDGHGVVSAWSKRQRESDDVASRVRDHRRRKQPRLKTDDAPSGNALENNETEPVRNVTETRQNRSEQKRTESYHPPSESLTPGARDEDEDRPSSVVVVPPDEPWPPEPEVAPDLIDELHERCMGLRTPSSIRRQVRTWVACLGSVPETERIIARRAEPGRPCATRSPTPTASSASRARTSSPPGRAPTARA